MPDFCPSTVLTDAQSNIRVQPARAAKLRGIKHVPPPHEPLRPAMISSNDNATATPNSETAVSEDAFAAMENDLTIDGEGA